MKIWLVMENLEWEGAAIVAAFSSPEAAEASIGKSDKPYRYFVEAVEVED